MPFVRPDTTHEPDAPAIVHDAPPGEAVTVCDVAGQAPNASVTVTLADASPATTPGAAGTFGISVPDVITRSPVPLSATATNRPLANVTAFHELKPGVVSNVQLMPSGLVITPLSLLPLLPVPTATNRPLPNVTESQDMLGVDLNVQAKPSRLVITC